MSFLNCHKGEGKYLPRYTVIRCPFNGHQVSWCRGLCEPMDGRGICGRIAAHAMKDRTQRAIAAYRAK
jgi:hypothetical protein